MKTAPRILGILGVAVGFLCTAVVAQRNSTVPQPQAGRLAAVGPARPNRGALVEKPTSVIPGAPDGFTVSAYAELDTPRMMVYAPNGDLFVSSPASNTITVLRDANNDGVFEARSVYAGTPPAARGGGAAPQAATPPPAGAAQAPCGSSRGQPDGQRPDPRRVCARVFATAGVQQPRPRHRCGAVRTCLSRRISLRRQYRVDRALQVLRRRPEGAGRAGEAARHARGRSLDTQHPVQPGGDEDVRLGWIAVEQQRGRGLPARCRARVQPGWFRLSGVCLGDPEPGGTGAAARHRYRVDRGQRARQPWRRSRSRLCDFAEGRRILWLAVFATSARTTTRATRVRFPIS